MKLKISSFTWESFNSESVLSVSLMTSSWEITILENHEPLLTSINPSDMSVVFLENWVKKTENFAIWKGIVEVSNNNVKVMADMLIDMDWINIDEVENARKKALELMEKYKSQDKIDMDKYIEAEDMLLRSVAQLKLYDVK